MPDSRNRPICPTCQRPMTLELQPSGLTPRTFQCLECDRSDPLKSPAVATLLNTLQPPKWAASMTAETLSQVEVQVYWVHRNDYEWRLVRWGSVIAKGRSPSYQKAKEAGEQAIK